MDNECPQITQDYLINLKKIPLLLVPPYMYRMNVAEKAIDSFKNNFISGLGTVHLDFLLYL